MRSKTSAVAPCIARGDPRAGPITFFCALAGAAEMAHHDEELMRESEPRTYYDTQYHFAEDSDRPNEGRLWHAMREIMPLQGRRVLDLGCGAGWAIRMALSRGASQGVGLDFSSTALGLARQHTPDASWVLADGSTLPFRDASFDRVFSHGAMEHFPDVREGFRELHRVLRPGGLAVTVVPNFYIRTSQPMEFRATRKGWRSVAEGAGLNVLRVGTDWGPAILKNTNVLRILLRLALRAISLIPPLRYQFIMVLMKPGAATRVENS